MRFVLPILALMGYSVAMPSLFMRQEARPPPDQIRFLEIKAGGSGCRTDKDYSIITNSDATVLSILYSSLVAEAKDGLNPTSNRKFCQHSIRLAIPNGWRFTVLTAEYRGYVSLPINATASLTSTYYFSGEAATATLSHKFIGPTVENYQKGDTLGMATTVYSPCGTETILQLKNSVDITPTGFKEPAIMQVDTNDLKVTQNFGVRWEPCIR